MAQCKRSFPDLERTELSQKASDIESRILKICTSSVRKWCISRKDLADWDSRMTIRDDVRLQLMI